MPHRIPRDEAFKVAIWMKEAETQKYMERQNFTWEALASRAKRQLKLRTTPRPSQMKGICKDLGISFRGVSVGGGLNMFILKNAIIELCEVVETLTETESVAEHMVQDLMQKLRGPELNRQTRVDHDKDEDIDGVEVLE